MPDAAPTPEPPPQPTHDQIIEAVYRFAADQMLAGVAPAVIEQKLVAQGLDEESAARVVNNLKEARARALTEAGQKNMLFGALWCVGGIVVTAVTYSAAAGGGTYVVAWGAILFGAIQFFRGWEQTSGKG